MKIEDVTDTLQLALDASGLEEAKIKQRPQLLSDIGSSYIAGDHAKRLDDEGMDHVRGAANHP